MNKRKLSFALALLLVFSIFASVFTTTTIADEYDDPIWEATYKHNLRMSTEMRDLYGDGTSKETLELYKLPRYGFDKHEKEIIELAQSIVKGISNDYEKAKAIHDWVATNIWYDRDGNKAFLLSSEPPYRYNTLETKLGVCAMYAALTVDLLRAAGIPAKNICGAISGERGFDEIGDNVFMWTGDGTHGWCEAYADGRWIIMDPTWDSLNYYVNGKYSEQQPCGNYWFDISLKDFSGTHKYNGYGYFTDIAETITIPDGFTSIGFKAFDYGFETETCRYLKTVNIPASVKSIGDNAFVNCINLVEVNIAEGLISIGENVFSGCKNLTNINIPNSVKSIGGGAFYECNSLTSLDIPNSVINIDGAFIQSGLISITVPNSIKSIGYNTFYYCEGLTDVILPDSVTEIEDYAFYECKNLTNIIIPDSVKSIGNMTFWGCKNLTIYGESGSYAEKYAKNNKIKFVAGTPPVPEFKAIPTPSKVLVNGKETAFDAYNINGNNYFKLRDLAYVLSGTIKQFEVGWDGKNNAISLTSDKPYTSVGGEMALKEKRENKTATPTTSKIYLDGKKVSLTAYNIDGNNYFKLRDIGQVFDFGVDWDGKNNTIVIDTGKSYNPE